MKEIWKDIPEYEHLYAASNLGQIKRIDKDRLMTQTPDKDGYLTVRLCKRNKARTCRISRLVLLTFVGEPESKAEALHLNHVRTDNRLSNLQWGSRQQNEDQKSLAGRRSAWSKLTKKQVEKMRKLKEQGKTLKEIGAIFGTHFSNVSLICRGVTHK